MTMGDTVIQDLKDRKETVWLNPDMRSVQPHSVISGEKFYKIQAAQNRLMRFMPYIASAFPETAAKVGLIESELYECEKLKEWMKEQGNRVSKHIMIKDDAHLPVAGSVKARGGIYEVLKHAEDILRKAGMLHPTDNYQIVDSDECRKVLSRYCIQVGSTGNLGLSIGIMSAKLGFRVIVHMSADARQWKKDMLRERGVTVIEYDSDYGEAVRCGREQSENDPMSYFVDDENSEDLFMGYATAAMRLYMQFYNKRIPVDMKHPLFVYLPCGVGGAPGGITYGLKQMYGDAVHCFFVEPIEMPCFTLGMASGRKNDISVYEIGLGSSTIADGLAVARPSGYVCDKMKDIVSGSLTVSDEHLLAYQQAIYNAEGIYVEPSGAAGLAGALQLYNSKLFAKYVKAHNLTDALPNATQIIWATGGGLVPEKERM